MKQSIIIFFILVFSNLSNTSFGAAYKTPELTIKTNFPGGNIVVDSIKGTTVYLRPELRDTDHEWFYWYFSITSNRSDSIRFVFTRKECMTIKGPAVSNDLGKSWKWLYAGTISNNEFTAYIKAGKELRFSMGMPYTQSNFDAFLKPYRFSANVRLDTLCVTPKGRATEKLVIHPLNSGNIRRKILITARHHACEMMANYVMEGLIASVLSKDPAMKALRESTEFWFIPFMDKDGVEDGDQGKYRAPRDHNRDYDGTSLYCSTSALRTQVPAWSNNQAEVMMDFHCPTLRGTWNEVIYMVGSAKPEIEEQQRKFLNHIVANNRGTLKYDTVKGLLAYGTAWNKASNTTQGMSSSQWTQTIPGIKLASSIEFPYAVHNNEIMTPEKLRLLGRDIAFAIQSYLTAQ
jgi:murein tripeptide amidase MpaA